MKSSLLFLLFLANTCFNSLKLSAQNGVTVAGGNGYGQAANQFNSPSDIFIDGAGNIYVADYTNQRVQKWAPGATAGVTVAGGNGLGSAANQLHGPSGVVVDSAGNIFVADIMNNRIQKWAPGSTSGVTVAGGNGYGPAANQLAFPTAIHVDGTGNIYIVDRINNRVQKWALGALTGVTVAGGNGLGSASNQLRNPTGLFVDASGVIYVADQDNYRIQKWAPGSLAGVTVAGGNGVGAAANQLYPYEVFVTSEGSMYIADRGNDRIQKWQPGALSGVTVAGGNGAGSAANQLNNPTDVFVDANGYLYVADEENHRIQKFDPVSLPVRLVMFDVLPESRLIKVEWSTASEQNNKGFEVQRSQKDMNEFKVIGWKEGKGYSNIKCDYSFYDEDVVPGVKYYYRLRQVDRDENFVYSGVKATLLKSVDMQMISISPNPVRSWLQLRFNSAEIGEVSIRVINAQGGLVLSKEYNVHADNRVNLNVSGLTRGQYYLVVLRNKELLASKVFLKR